MKEWYSANEVIRRSGIAESTARRYIVKFNHYFITQPNRKPKRYDLTAPEIIRRINDLYLAGKSTNDINEILKQETFHVIETDPVKELRSESEQLTIIQQLSDLNETLVQTLNHISEKLQESIAESRASRAEIQELTRRISELEVKQLPDPQQKEEKKARRKWYQIFKK